MAPLGLSCNTPAFLVQHVGSSSVIRGWTGSVESATGPPGKFWEMFADEYFSLGASQVVLVVKNPHANAGDIIDMGLIPGLGRSRGGGHGNPLQYSSLENPKDRKAWQATVHGIAKSWIWLKWLCRQVEIRFSLVMIAMGWLAISSNCFRTHVCSMCLHMRTHQHVYIHTDVYSCDRSLSQTLHYNHIGVSQLAMKGVNTSTWRSFFLKWPHCHPYYWLEFLTVFEKRW